ncbi:hypothetical protein FNV43_RR27348 [Rhamnella rubrinervis]|uniref:Uncharacterized protein n=1 Tax=Rhamnella rubrinervis TaxID=2594499 RepID=A0A8K0DP85_9ROSA|nr:hypothetical protein FNV43_RR27348 [Rhamnella rubrinervis]
MNILSSFKCGSTRTFSLLTSKITLKYIDVAKSIATAAIRTVACSIDHNTTSMGIISAVRTVACSSDHNTKSMSIISSIRIITCSTDHNAASPPFTDSGSDSNDDIATISQAIKKRRTTTSNIARPGPDGSHKINSHPIVTIGPSWTETEMRISPNSGFNSHLIIKDITDAIDEELATFNKCCENIFDAASHCSSMISLQTSIQSKASEYTMVSAKLTAQEHLVKELKAKLVETEDVYGNMRHSIQLTIDEATKEKK